MELLLIITSIQIMTTHLLHLFVFIWYSIHWIFFSLIAWRHYWQWRYLYFSLCELAKKMDLLGERHIFWPLSPFHFEFTYVKLLQIVHENVIFLLFFSKINKRGIICWFKIYCIIGFKFDVSILSNMVSELGLAKYMPLLSHCTLEWESLFPN